MSYCKHGQPEGAMCDECAAKQEGVSSFAAPACSADWDAPRVDNVVATCRLQIKRLRMKMPINVALALGRADEELADAQAWMRAENPPNDPS